MVDLAYRASMQDGFTAPAKAVRDSANAMGQAVENAGRVTEESSERVRRSARSFAQLVTANDDAARAAAANAKIQAKLARDVQTVNAEVAAGLATQQQANALLKDMTEKAALAAAQIERRIAREKLQRAALQDTTEATTEQARALQGLRSQYDPLYAAQQRLGTSMRDIAKLEREGFISGQQALALRERETRAYGERSRELNGVAQAEREAARAAKERAVEEQRAAEARTAQARSLEALRGQYDPLYAAAQRYGQVLRDISSLEQEGLVTAGQAVQMREREAATYQQRQRDLSGVTAAERQAAQAAKEHAAEQRRAADEQVAQTRGLEALRGQYDPLYAAGQRYGQMLREISALEREGAITAQQATEIRERQAAQHEQTRRELTGVAAAERGAAAAAEEHAAELARLEGRLTGYVHAMDPVAASLAAVERAERDLMEARRQGLAVSSDQVAAVVRQRERHEELAVSSTKVGGAIRLQAYEWTNLTYQMQDTVVSLLGGQNPFLVLAQQAPQATSAVGGTSRGMALLRQEITPARLAILGVTAAVVAMAVAVHTQESALSGLRAGLRGVSADYAAAAVEMEASAKRVAAAGLGIGRQEARDGLMTLRQAAPRGSTIDYDAAGRDAANLAAILRTDVAAGFELMARMGKDAGAVVEELREKGIRGMTRELQGQVEALQANGQRWEAQTQVMSRLRPVMQGAAQDVPPLTQAMRDLRSAWDGFIDKASGGLGGAAMSMLRDLSQLLSLVEKAVNLARSIPGMKQFLEIADAGPVEAGLAARRSLGLGEGNATDRALAQMGRSFGPATPNAVAAQGTSVPWSVPADLRPAFANAAASTGLDVELLARVFGREGVRNRDGTWRDSSVGAVGPMQVMPDTFADMAKKYGIQGTARDDSANVMAGARYLVEMIQRFPGDLPRAMAGYNAGPDREGLGSPALGGTYARRVLDGYSGTGLTVRAEQVSLSGTAGNPLVLPTVEVTASSDVRLDRALAISRGEMKPPEHGSRETQAAWYQGAIGEVREGMGLTTDPRSLDILRNGLRELAKAAEGARGPAALLREEMDRSIASARILDPAQRAVADAVSNYEERLRAAGEVPSDQGRNEARARALQLLGVAYAAAGRDVGRSLQQQSQLAEAWGQDREAVERLTAEEKAREVVRAAGIQGEAAQEAAVRKLADSYQLLTGRQADNAQRAANDNSRANLDVLEEERRLIGASADERERELASYKAVQQARRGGVRDEGVLEETRKLARSTVDVTRANTQLRNSWDELSRIGEQAFDRIGSAITEAFANGSLKALDFKNIAKAALSEVAQAGLRMALVNPVLNDMDGGTRGTLGGVLTVAGAMGGGGAAANDNRSGSSSSNGMVSYAQQGLQAYSAYDKLKGLNPSNSINGTSSFSTGWSAADGVLNAPLWAGAANSGVNASGAVTNAAGYGSMAQNSIDAAGSASAGGVGSNGLTYGGAALGALGVGAGLYGTYSGIQRGGVGGYTSAAGSAASAGLSAAAMAGVTVPIYGWIAAAALMIIGALLPGQKPSDKTGTAVFDTNDLANPTIGGLNGNRFSQENRDQAKAIGAQLGSIAQTVGQAAGLSQEVAARYEVAYGARDGIKVAVNGENLQGAADEAGITAITKAFTSQMLALAQQQSTDENVRGLIGRKGIADPDATLNALTFYETTWKTMQKPLEQTRTGLEVFQAQLAELKAPFQAVIDKSIELGLSTEKLLERQQEAIDYARGQVAQNYDQSMWAAQGRGYIQSLRDVRQNFETNGELLRTVGRNPEDLYNEQARAVLKQLNVEQLRDVATNFVSWDGAMAVLARELLASADAAAAAAQAAQRLSVSNGLWDRFQAATGNSDTQAGARWDYERRAQVEWTDAVASGIVDLTQLAQVQNAERLAIDKRYAEHAAALRQGYEDRVWAATADTSTMVGALADFDRNAMRERLEAAKQAGADLVLLEQAQGAERAQLIRQFAEQEREAIRGLGGNIRAYLDSLRATPNGGRSPADQLTAAQDIFGRDLALARGGDQEALGRITSSADTLLSAGREMYASGQEFQQLRDWIASSLEALPATRSYDAMILEELRKLGGSIDVSVELTTIRIITEQLNALPASERDRLIQAEVVLRSVEDRLGRQLTAVERGLLIDSAAVMRSIEQLLGRDLTAAERAGLVDSATVRRSVEQAMGRDLTAAERALLVDSASILRTVQQALGRDLTAAERAGLVQAATVQRLIEQQLGRQLTAAERATLLETFTATRTVEQILGRDLTVAERATLLASATVIRTVEQGLGRVLTAAEVAQLLASGTVTRAVQEQLGRVLTSGEQAALIAGGGVIRSIQDVLGRQLTPAEQAALIQSASVVRTVTQAVETTETVAISRSIDDKLSGLLSQLVSQGNVQLGIASDMRGFLARVAGADDGVTIRLGTDANVLFQDLRGLTSGIWQRLGGFDNGVVVKPSTAFPVYAADPNGIAVQTVQKYDPSWQPVRFAKGGVLGAGRGEILTGPTDLMLGDGTSIQVGEAGAEGIFPLRRGRNGEMGVQALITLSTASLAPEPTMLLPLPPMPMAGGGDLAAIEAQLRTVLQELAEMKRIAAAEAQRQAQADSKAQQTLETVAEEAGDMADSNRRILTTGRGVVAQRAGAR